MKRAFSEKGESRRRRRREAKVKWSSWSGQNAYRLIVPTSKVGRVIGRAGETVKNICVETRAFVRVFQGAVVQFPDSIVLISGKEEPEKEHSRAMLGTIRVFKRITGISTGEDGDIGSAEARVQLCTAKLLIPSKQVHYLIKRKEHALRSITEESRVVLRISSVGTVMPYYATENEQVIEIEGEAVKVLRALESVLRHLRKFLVDYNDLPLFERMYYKATSEVHSTDSWDDKSYSLRHCALYVTTVGPMSSLPLKKSLMYVDPTIRQPGLRIYDQNRGLGHTASPMDLQMIETMEVPLSYVDKVIGEGGVQIEYIRRSSRAIVNVKMSSCSPDKATIEMKGTFSQIQKAQQLIQEFTGNYRVPPTPINYGRCDKGSNQYSESRSPDTTFHRSPSFSWYLEKNESHRSGGYR
ncbi:hypothetical protein ACOSP7_007905 [Xanthoceras sorbifolium]